MMTRTRLPVAALLALLLLGGCDDLIVDGGARQVTGLTIADAGGAQLASVTGTQVSGSVQVARNADRTLVVTLLGAGGVITPSLAETVRVTVTNPGVASWQDGGSGTGVLRGNSAGSTTLRVDLIRAGVVAYTSPAIAVSVS